MSTRLRSAALSLLTVFALGGCSVLPRPAPPPRHHDFGADTPSDRVPRVSVGLDRVTAPPWLSGDAILYRFLTRDPTRLRAYAENRWIAPGPRLIAEAVRDRLPADRRPRYHLQLRLERFEQDFTGRTQATVVVRIRAVILGHADAVTAQRTFQLSTHTLPDVSGAIGGLSDLARRAAREISAWAAACTDSVGSAPFSACRGS